MMLFHGNLFIVGHQRNIEGYAKNELLQSGEGFLNKRLRFLDESMTTGTSV